MSNSVVAHKVVCGVSVLMYGLPDSIEEQSNPNATSEQHHKPSNGVELWFIIWLSKFQLGVLAEVEGNDEDCPDVLGSDVKPGEVGQDHGFPVEQWNITFQDEAPSNKENDESY